MSDKIKKTFYARFCGTPEESALGALEFVCSEADRLESENAELKDHISQAEKMVDVRKLVKPLQWIDTNDGTRSDCRIGNIWICVYAAMWTQDPNSDLWFIGHSDSSEQCIDSLSHIDHNAKNLEEAKQFAQDWLVSLVSNACGIEVRK